MLPCHLGRLRHCAPAAYLVAAHQFTHYPAEISEHLEGISMPGHTSKFTMTRRGLLAGAAAASVLPAPRVLAQSSAPLRIGFLPVTTGPLAAGGFQLAFEAAGGKIVQKLWPPLNAPEYGVYLAQIKSDVDAIYTGFAGSNPLRFLKAFADFGLKGKVAVLGNTTMTDEGILKAMGDEAVGVYSAGWYAAGLDTPDNKKFVAGINAAYKHDPGFYTAGPYTALLIIEQALKTTKGKTDDAAAFLKAMHEVRLTEGPIGPVKLDEYGTPILDIHIRKVARINGKLVNTIIKTYPQVSQFWTTDPKEAVKQPVFSRDFPPSKNLE